MIASAVKTGSLVDVRFLTNEILHVKIKVQAKDFSYKPGQFIALAPKASSGSESEQWSYYSVASCMRSDQTFELCVSAEGWFNKHKDSNGELYLQEAAGNLLLPEKLDKKLVMIATGTGVAPFRAMIQHISKNNVAHSGIHLIHGCKNAESLLFSDEFFQLSGDLRGFTYDPVVSRDVNWTGNIGRVDAVYLKVYGKPQNDVLFYLCGQADMIKNTVHQLVDKVGYEPQQLIYELYE